MAKTNVIQISLNQLFSERHFEKEKELERARYYFV